MAVPPSSHPSIHPSPIYQPSLCLSFPQGTDIPSSWWCDGPSHSSQGHKWMPPITLLWVLFIGPPKWHNESSVLEQVDLIILQCTKGILLCYTVIIKGQKKEKKEWTNIPPPWIWETCEAVCYCHSRPCTDSRAVPSGIHLISTQMRSPSVFEGGGSHLSNLLWLSELWLVYKRQGLVACVVLCFNVTATVWIKQRTGSN